MDVFGKKEYTLSAIAEITGGRVSGNHNLTITEIITDSRRVVFAGKALFIALKGPNHDGHDYISSLYAQQVRSFLVERVPEKTEDYPEAGFIKVPDTLEALQQIAGFHRSGFHAPLIAITGSNGKTMVKEWLAGLLTPGKNVIKSPGSFNSQVGVPLSLWLLAPGYDYALLEAGISMPGEMENLEKIICPDIGIFTNIGDAHQENFESMEQKLQEKLLLFRNVEVLITRENHHQYFPVVQAFCAQHNIRLFTWGKGKNTQLHILKTKKERGKTHIRVGWGGKEYKLVIPFTDAASFENSMHVLATLSYLGLNLEKILPRFASLEPVAMRMEMRKGINNCLLIDDFYNADLHSLSMALGFLKQQTRKKKHSLILSDILQSGKKEEVLYFELAGLVKGQNLYRFIGIGEGLFHYRALFGDKAVFYPSTESFLQSLKEDEFDNEVILMKGARKFHFEDISLRLEQQVHKTILEVNLDAMVHNLNFYKQLLKPETRIMVMVKALSYGSGVYEIAQALEYQQVDFLAVAYPDEGMALRVAGIRTPVVVMNADISSVRQLVKYNLEPVIYGIDHFIKYNQFFKKEGMVHYPVHLKIDSGMHRLGFLPEEATWIGERISENRTMFIRSLFSHLAASDNKQHDAFTLQQIETFLAATKVIEAKLPYRPIRHILNTSGIERFPEAQLDMVRLGLGLHGLSEKYGDNLRVVSTFKSVISQIKTVKKGETVGYDRLERAQKDITIAIIPVGYADGLPIYLGNRKGAVVIKNKKAPLVGRICMDMCMADITGLKVVPGDEVEIFGPRLPVMEICIIAKTIPYDILTGISSRVKRNYIQE